MARHRDPPSQPQREHHQGRTGGAGLGSAAPQALGSPASAQGTRAPTCAYVCVFLAQSTRRALPRGLK